MTYIRYIPVVVICGAVEHRRCQRGLPTGHHAMPSGDTGRLPVGGQRITACGDRAPVPSHDRSRDGNDFAHPRARVSIGARHVRRAQVRWTEKLGGGVAWSAAVEDNASDIVPPETAPGWRNTRCRIW